MANRINIPQFSGPQQVNRAIDGTANYVLGFDSNGKLSAIDPSTITPTSETLTTPVIAGGLTASGSGANDFSASTGTFKTSSGANTLSGAVSVADATTPSVTTATGKTNTGFVTVLGKTSGGLKLTAADATAQTVTMTTAAQTVGAATITIPDLAGTSVTPAYLTTAQALTNKTLTAPVINGATSASGNFDLSGSTGTFITSTGANTISGAATMATGKSLTLAAGTTAIAPLNLVSGTNLTSAAAGAIEYDGAAFYATADATSGRAHNITQNYFRLTSNGSTISTIANYFGTTSNISLVASAFYEIEIFAFFLNSTSGTVVWTLTNSAAPTLQNIVYEMSPVTGVVAPPGTATMLLGQIIGDATATKALTATGALTDAVNHYMRMKIWLQNGTGTSLKIQATKSAGSITPLVGSYYVARRLPASSTGTFSA